MHTRLLIHVLRQALVLACLFSLWPGTAAAAPAIDEIQSLANAGNIQQALKKTDDLLAKDPGNIEGRFYKGLLLTRSNQLEQAEAVFNALIEDHPGLPEPYNNLAVVYAAQGKYDQARDLLSRAIHTHPSYATAHENLGDIYAKMASKAYNQVLELDDDNRSAREKLSLINELFSRPEPLQTVAAAQPVPEPVVAATRTEPAPPKPKVAEPKPPEAVAATAAPAVAAGQPAPGPIRDITPTILAALNDWARAWESQDVDNYLSYYASSFIPDDGMTRSQWRAQRQKRLSRPGFIKIGISSPEVTMHGDSHAEVEFMQSYQSDTYSDRVRKQILFSYENNRWLIAEERSN